MKGCGRDWKARCGPLSAPVCWLPGSSLPATRVLAAELGISRGTVSAAYDQLVAQGYLLARHGSATTVAPVPGLSRRPGSRPSVRPRHELRAGTPDVTAFPVAAWLRSARRALNSAPATAFGYAADRRGRPELRAALADYLGRARGVAASAERIVVTAGYAQALSLLALALGPAGSRWRTRACLTTASWPYTRVIRSCRCRWMNSAPTPRRSRRTLPPPWSHPRISIRAA